MKTTKKPKGPKRLKLSELCDKHGIPMWPKPYRVAMVHIGGIDRYNEFDWQISRPVLRSLRNDGCIDHDKPKVGSGGIFWFATPKGLAMREGIIAVESERAEQKRLGHGLIPITA
jgi:hypothetical protein